MTDRPNPYPGTWIVLDGPDGSGTTTAGIRLVGEVFNADKANLVKLTREPTKRQYGLQIRKMFAGDMDIASTGQTLLDLFVADRFDHMKHVVVPDVMQGNIVIQDRSLYSTLVYQGLQGIPYEKILDMHKGLPLLPDAVLIFDVAFDEAQRRMGKGEEHQEAFDKDTEFQRQVNEAYHALPGIMAQLAPKHPIHLIDANQSVDDVVAQCWNIIEPLLPYNKRG